MAGVSGEVRKGGGRGRPAEKRGSLGGRGGGAGGGVEAGRRGLGAPAVEQLCEGLAKGPVEAAVDL